jgi:hypothetical protein
LIGSELTAQLTGKLRRSLGECIRLIDSTPIRLNSQCRLGALFAHRVRRQGPYHP